MEDTVQDFVKKFNLEDSISDVARSNLDTNLGDFAKSFGKPVTPEIDVEDMSQSPVASPEQPVGVEDTIIESIRNISSLLSPEEMRAERDLRRQEESLLELQGAVIERGREQARLGQQLGIPDFEQEIFDIASAVQQKRASLTQGLVTEEGRVVPMGVITGRQAQMRKQAAAEIEGLQAAAEAAQNNISAANSRIDRALNIKYGDLEQRIEVAKTALSVNESRFSRAEKRAAQQRQTELNLLQNQLQEKKDQEKQAMELVLSAQAEGFPPSSASETIKQIQNGEIDIADVAGRVGPYVGAQDRIYKQLQIQALQQQLSGDGTPGIKPLTASQQQALTFGTRMLEAESVIEEVGGQFTGFLDRISGSKFFPQGLKSDDRQKFEQAQRNFINAVLRRESGAAISPEEFTSAERQYFPQPGDSTAVLIQKKQNRATVTRGLLAEAGQDTTPQEAVINDPLGLGITPETNNPLEI